MIAVFFVSFWLLLMILFSLSAIRAIKEGAEQVKKLHRIPCYKCDFFTKDYRLKCTVHPSKACSEEALGCIDFEPNNINENISRRRWEKSYEFHLSETQLQNVNAESNS